jgi:hypothetical protein
MRLAGHGRGYVAVWLGPDRQVQGVKAELLRRREAQRLPFGRYRLDYLVGF